MCSQLFGGVRGGSCFFEAFANVWVDFYHAAFVSRQALASEQQQIRMSLVQRELHSCKQQLEKKELELQTRVEILGKEAVARKNSKDLPGAKKRMLERRRMQGQLQKLQNTMMTIEMHRSTIEGSALDRTVLETLKSSADALRQIGTSSAGLRAVEDIVADVQHQMENAAEITQILASGNITGMVNTMAVDGIVVDEDELMQELEEMLDEDAHTLAPQNASFPQLLQNLPVPYVSPQLSRVEESSSVRRILQMQADDV